MAHKDEQPVEAEQTASDPLSRWQRLAASVVGTVSAGAGGVSVFMTSNQAGSVALLAVGAGFLIMSVNGTPVLGAKLKDYELTMAPRRRKVLEQVKLEAPAQASLALDVLQQVDPGARRDPAVGHMRLALYQQEVLTALMRVLSDDDAVLIRQRDDDSFVAGVVRSRDNLIDVDIRYSGAPESTTLRTGILEKIYLDAQNRIMKR